MDFISECLNDRCLMKYAGMSLVRRNGDPNFDTEKELEKFLGIAAHQHETLIALRAEHEGFKNRIKELEAINKILYDAQNAILFTAADASRDIDRLVTQLRDEMESQKTDSDDADRPVNGDGGE